MKRSSIELEIITNIIGGRILFSFAKNGFYLYPNIQGVSKNIAKGTTDPRVEFILPKLLLEVISEVQT